MMTRNTHSRRAVLIGMATVLAMPPLRATAQAAAPAIHVLKDPDCGCCADWMAILAADGFVVTSEPVAGSDLQRVKDASGIPPDMVSCHTARVGGYVIEGHVPAADIRRLLDQRPDGLGLAVPGMPYGSPGMGPETEREAYDVFLIRKDGSAEVFSRYAAA